MSQVNKLFIMLQDNEPHSTIDICAEVYGDGHLGLARVGARIWDLKKKYGLNIESWRDPKIKTIWWYRLISKENKIEQSIPVLNSEKPEQNTLFKIKYDPA